MKTRRYFESLAIIGTGLALVAHGGSERLCALSNAESVDFDVVGTCGPSGHVTVSTKDGQCGLDVTGDDVGVPTHGDAGSIRSGGWHTEGAVASRGGETLSCATYHVDTTDDNRFVMSCYGDGKKQCESYFIDVSENCDVDACTVTECRDGFMMELPPGECCPRCVECSTCVYESEPDPEPTCDPTQCPQSCEDGFELTDVGDDCCLSCTPVIDLEACEAGRAEYQREFDAQLSTFLPCSSDAECMVIQASDACAVHCDLLVGGASFGQPFAMLSESAAELCLACPAPESNCSPIPPPTAQCVEGTCVRDEP
jgi:hypothetical protein